MSETKPFWDYAQERYKIFLRKKAGLPPPWTTDGALQTYYFTNIFREDDKVTVWFREVIRDMFKDDPPAAVFACCLFRLHTNIKTADALLNEELFAHWDGDLGLAVLREVQARGPIVTGAYMIRGINGMTKAESIAHIATRIWRDRKRLAEDMIIPGSLQEATKLLTKYPAIGPFMAYEMVTDLRHTSVLENAEDIMTWANPGPGCMRGIDELWDNAPNPQDAMRLLLWESQHTDRWYSGWPKWEMRDVEHTLCEFSKYSRAKRGWQQKRLYTKGRP